MSRQPSPRKPSRRKTAPKRPPFSLGDREVHAGQREQIPLPVGTFLTHEELSLRISVVHGKSEGPTLLLTAGIHGDEYNGTEIIRRILRHPRLSKLAGTLIAAPIVNRPGFVTRSRYMPDRRDLNRLFPGSPNGSLGGRLAHVLTQQVLPLADAVIDLHTGAINRPNFPQIRIDPDLPGTLELARVFDPPVMLLGKSREGTFRNACVALGKPSLLYEAGEALRLDAPSIRFGTEGVLAVLQHLQMLPPTKRSRRRTPTLVSKKSYWERAPVGGIFTPLVALGKAVEKGGLLGFIADPHGSRETPVNASNAGVLIGRTNEAVADEGDGLFHIATLENLETAEHSIARTADALPTLGSDEDDHPVPYDSLNDTIS
ncbi:MAG: succinylglutamate desuccinylase/aspartoacylase family protein [Verrucomicrobiales bacterium]